MQEAVNLGIRQFVDAWRVMCTPAPGYAESATADVHYVFSGVPIGFFNIALLTGQQISADALQAHARDAVAWAAQHRVPWMLIVTHERLAPGLDAAAVLDDCGLAPVMPLTGMRAERITPVARVPSGLELNVAEDDAACATVVDINAVAYDMPLDAAKDLIGKRAFWTTDRVAVLGTTAGQPASCAAVLMVEGYRYVALVATSPGYQRRGYAEAAMRRALEHAAEVHGERPTVLHATAAGRPIYERMGYEAISNHTVFMEKTFLDGH